jgi:hypothetical protein
MHLEAGFAYKDCCPASAGGKTSRGTKPQAGAQPMSCLLIRRPRECILHPEGQSSHTHTLLSTASLLHHIDRELSRQSRSHGIHSPLFHPTSMPCGTSPANRLRDASRLQVAAMGSPARCLPDFRSHGHPTTIASNHPRHSQ